MNREELAFTNQQLAGMLQCGIPLEGGLRQLCENLRRGSLRTELEQLEADLSKGTPLREALVARQLPEFYKEMLVIGAESNNLPGMLNLLADYYTQTHVLATRLKGLLVYPALAFLLTLALTATLALVFQPLVQEVITGMLEREDTPGMNSMWILPGMMLVIAIALVVVGMMPLLRRKLFWILPGFRDIGLARVGAAMSLLLKGGVPLPQALGVVGRMEQPGPAAEDLQAWHARVSEGKGRLDQLATSFKALPPLFIWVVASSGDDLARGFGRAAEIYGRRARHQSEMILYAAMPVGILFVGFFLVGQLIPMFQAFARLMNAIGG